MKEDKQMKNIEFDEERRGYDKQQVEVYVTMLQDSLKERTDQCNALKDELAGKDRLSVSEKREMADLQRRVVELQEERDIAISENKALDVKCQNAERQYRDQVKELEVRIARMSAEKDEMSVSSRAVTDLNEKLLEKEKEIRELTEETKKVMEENKKLREENSETAAFESIEQLFQVAKQSADEFVDNTKKNAQEERNRIEAENQKLIEEAKKEAEEILREAREQKQVELEQKIREVEKMEQEKKEEIEYLKQDALDEIDNAKIEADGIRNQAKLILSQAEQKSARMIQRAEDRVNTLTGPIKEECEKVCVDMEVAMRRFADFYKDIIQNEQMEG